MSRICVKNLPKFVAEDRLREFFSQKGEVTDAKLMRTKDGNSRQFGFVGFRTEGEAKEALKYFNNSYMDTFRITCEIARKIGDPNIPRPWSRHSAKMQEKLTENKNKVTAAKNSPADSKGDKKSSKKGSENNDPQLQEFLEIMQPRSKSKLWANDTLDASFVDQNDKAGEKHTQSNVEVRKESASVLEELDETDEREDVLPESHLVKQSHVGSDTVSDMDYFKSRVKKEWSDPENDDNNNDDNNSIDESPSDEDVQNLDLIESLDASRVSPPDNVKEEGPSEDSNGEMVDSDKLSSGLKDEQEVLETGRLFIRNLPYTATEDDLEELFSKFGNVSQVHLVVDKDTKRSKGIAYVLYSFPESAVRALEELDNSIFQGRLLHIMPAKQKNPSENQDVSANQVPKTFKQQREDQRKASEASGDTRAWNSLFIRPDTVVEYLARKHGVSKSDLLDQEADNLAVRIAWGETTVIKETKEALKNAGVNIEALEEFTTGKTDDVRRSNHVLLVKNLPYASSEGELAKMFGKFGSLDKIIIPPTKTLALVVFLEAAEARAAFKGLAYKRYKDAPLYLEWAPSNIISGNVVVGEKDVERVLLEQNVEGISEVDIDPDRVESRSLFVKNLNFRTSDEGLRKHFSENIEEGKIRSVRVKKHLKNGKNVSMGFGFIEFDSVETATNICRDLQGTVLDGHALILQLCHAKKDEQILKKIDKDKSMTKLLVRNVAFEATEKDLRQLFSPFGQVKSLRVPMKFGSHRGFAFVEYVTKQEAENALQALSSTHLYGRHLVLERAKEGESLEELRARTAAQFAEEENNFHNPIKLSKKRKHLSVVDEGNIKFQRIAD